MVRIDLAILNAAQLLTVADDGKGPRRGPRQNELDVLADAGIAVSGDRIIDVGPSAAVAGRHDLGQATIIDATGKIVLPGLVDSHTHPIFSVDRCDEYAERLAGKSLSEIAAAGGGIWSTVTHTRTASDERLAVTFETTLAAMLHHGTTTIEAKSGYGQTTEQELRLLRLIDDVARRTRANIVPTFLGAHVVPRDEENADAYVERIIAEMLPAVAAQGIAKFCDVSCEKGWFSNEQCRRILERSSALGLKTKFHVDAFAAGGGWRQAVAAHAISADHLTFTPDTEIEEAGTTDTVAVLMPEAELCYFSTRRANARKLIETGVPVAIATDFCSSIHASSLLQALPIAAAWFRMTPEEVIIGATLNGAYAIGLAESVGSLQAGKRADILVIDVPDYRRLAYEFGGERISHVVAGGELIRRPAQE
ncbi:MAG: imidazolonepropionase [Parvibaculaceae bacterium]